MASLNAFEIRRTPKELRALYRLEPDLRDLFVEGPRDKKIFSDYFTSIAATNVHVYVTDTHVNLPAEALAEYSLSTGARARNIALSRVLADLPLQLLRVVVDRDDGFLSERAPELGRHCLLTDYRDLESYIFNASVISRFLESCAPSWQGTAATLLVTLEPTLVSVGVLHAAHSRLDLRCGWLTPSSVCTGANPGIQFDAPEFIVRLLNKGGRREEEGRLTALWLSDLAAATGDPRLYIRGHDFIDLLRWFLHANLDPAERSVKAVTDALYGEIVNDELGGEALFTELRRWAKS